MRKFLCLIILLPILAFAQTQQGYVKSLGRPEKPGTSLSGVTIRQSGAHNAVVSGNNGAFSLNMIGKKLGDPYSLQQVRKDKYELVERDVVGRKYAYSNTVPLTIVMVSTEQLEKDKMRIENNAYKRAEKDYKQKSSALEKQLNEQTITEEKFQEEIQALINNFDKYQSMIDGLADHYARTDYDYLDEREREINICIENGELERADSLLHSIDNFDPIEVLKRNKDALAKLDAQIAQAEGMIAEANADMAEVLRRQEKDAEYLYQLYTIALARYDNEKAAKYIETRADLDTTNVQWQLEAGLFVSDYLANYEKALEYYNRALRNAIKQYGEEHKYVAISYNNIGLGYALQGKYNEALNYCQNALELILHTHDITHQNIASSYMNIGGIHKLQGKYDNALNYYQKALEIYLQIFSDQHPNVASTYTLIGEVYERQGKFDKALEYLHKSLDISVQVYGEIHPDIATSYIYIGEINGFQGKYDNALNYYQKALKICMLVYGNSHPNIATIYNNIGSTFVSQGKYNEASNFYQKALGIYQQIYDNAHPNIAASLNNLGNLFAKQGKYDVALDYYLRALEIEQQSQNSQHSNIGIAYNNIGNIYIKQKEYSKAFDYIQKALSIFEQSNMNIHPEVANCYNNLGLVYFYQGYYPETLKCYYKALDINTQVYGETHPNVAINHYNLIEMCYTLGDFANALKHCNACQNLMLEYGNDSPLIRQLYMYKYGAYTKLVSFNNSYQSEYLTFLENIVFVATIVDGDTPASRQGLTGEYLLLEFADWNMESINDLFEKNAELQGKHKTLVLMKDGNISSHYFETVIGAQLGVKWVSKEEKQEILKQYHNWKTNKK